MINGEMLSYISEWKQQQMGWRRRKEGWFYTRGKLFYDRSRHHGWMGGWMGCKE